MVAGSSQRWFAPGFMERNSDTAGRLLQTLSDTDDESYSLACEALAEFDRRPDLDRITVPFLLGPGEHDGVVPPARARQDADAITGSRLQVFAGCGHLPPAESPNAVAQALTGFFAP
jgi:3-oxoadipate enol-lactonase/3-oxoadipate enol-lactonase/4-carboxymuconolactone decarboxylase